MLAPETESMDANVHQESSGIYKGSISGKHLPFPNKKAEYLNTGALRKLLPSHRPTSPNLKPQENIEKESDEILRRMLQGDGRLKELDRKASKERARQIRIDDERRTKTLRENRKRRKKNKNNIHSSLSIHEQGQIEEDEIGTEEWDQVSKSSSFSTVNSRGNLLKLTVDEIAPAHLLYQIGMTREEFETMDRVYKSVASQSRSSHSTNGGSSSHQLSNSAPSSFYTPPAQIKVLRKMDLTIEEKVLDALKMVHNPLYHDTNNDDDGGLTFESSSISNVDDSNVNLHRAKGHQEGLVRGEKVTRKAIAQALSSQGIDLEMKALDEALGSSSMIGDSVEEGGGDDDDDEAAMTNGDEVFGDTWGDHDDEQSDNDGGGGGGGGKRSKSNEIKVKPKSPNIQKNVVNKIQVQEKQMYEVTSPEMLKNRLVASACRSLAAKKLGPGYIGQTGFVELSFTGQSSQNNFSSDGNAFPPQTLDRSSFGGGFDYGSTSSSGLPPPPLSLTNNLRPVKLRARATARRHLASTQSSQPQSNELNTLTTATSLSSSTTNQNSQFQHKNNKSKSSIIRSTPRLLKRGAQGDMIELRHELESSEKGLAALQQAVKEDVQWVSLNVSSENMSMRAQFFCKQWGAEKIQNLFVGSELNRQRLFLRRWAMACDLAYNMERLDLFLRFCSTRKFLLTFDRALLRARNRCFKLWQRSFFLEKEDEKDCACCEIQRLVLGFLGRKKFLRIRHQKATVLLQSAIRVSRAVARVRRARRAKLEEMSANLIRKNWNDVISCRKAKKITQDMREKNAATLIQKITRNREQIKKSKKIVQEQRINVNALKIQQLLRRKIANRKIYVLKRIKYEQKCALQIQLCWRRRKARIILKHKRHKKSSCLILQCWARVLIANEVVRLLCIERDRKLAAERIQRAGRVRKANNTVKEKRRIRRERDEREASIKLQKMARQKKATDKVNKMRAERDRKIRERNDAATHIQSSQRAKKSRKIVQIRREEEAARIAEEKRIAAIEQAASIQMQKGARGYRDRKYAQIKHEEREVARAKQRELEYNSATKIQSQARRRKAVKKVNARRKYRVDEDSEGGILIEEKALIIQCAFRTSMAKADVHERLLIKHDKQAAAEKEALELARIKAAEELAELERQRLARIELENKSALVLQQAERSKVARGVLAQKKFEEAERIRLEAEAEERRRRNAAATQIQRIMRGYLGKRKIGMRRAELSFAELCGGKASREIKALQYRLRDEIFSGVDETGELEIATGKGAIIAMQKRIAEIENQHFAIAAIASQKVLIEGHVKVLALWAETSNKITVRQRELASEHKRLRSNMAHDQKAAGVAGTPQGDIGLSELENQCVTEIDQRKAQDAALLSQTIAKANELAAESEVWANQAERSAKLGGEGADLAAERGVLTASLQEIEKKKDKAQAKAIANAVYSVNSMASAQSAAAMARLQAVEIEQQRYRLDVEMAARQHDGKSVHAAIIIQCLLRMRLANKLVNKKMGEESDSDDGGGRRRGRRGRGRPKSRGGKSDKGNQPDSDSDEDEERYRKKNKKRKKRMEKREERKRLQAEYEKRRAAGEVLDSLSEMEPSDMEDLPPEKQKQIMAAAAAAVEVEPEPPKLTGPPILPGQVGDNPLLYGDDNEHKAAENVFGRMFKRQGVDPRTAPYNTSALLARRAKTPQTNGAGSGSESGGGGLLGKLGGRNILGGDSSDADESSGDENAFATKAFASMGATSKIVPLNRNMIRAEADNAMDEKLSGLLDEKLKAIDDSKKQLMELQDGIVEKMKLLDEKVEASNQLALIAQTAAAESNEQAMILARSQQDNVGALVPARGSGDMATVESDHALPAGWSEMYDEASGASYYFNDVTGETSWTAPNHNYESDGYDTSGSKGTAVDYDTDAAWDSGYDTGAGGGEETWEAGYGDDAYGASGGEWTEQWDEEVQAAYWFNSVTLEASWTQPDGWDPSGATAGGSGDVGEWISYIDDESGKEYWYNEATEETSWTPR